jgi:hypothetical protein
MAWWMAVAGAAINQYSSWKQSTQGQDELRRQRRLAEQQYQYQREYNDASFNLARDTARADLSVAGNRLAQAYGADMAAFNLGLEGQAMENQRARFDLADSEGAARAGQGMSGTRGNDALERRIDYQTRSFDRQTELRQRSNSHAVNDMTRSYSYQFDDIGRELDSWSAGGYRRKEKALSDTYAAQTHGLQMAEFDRAISDAGFTFLDFLESGLTGAAQGMGFGSQLGELKDQRQSGGGGGVTLPQAQNYMTDYNNSLGINRGSFWNNYYLYGKPSL